MMSFQNLNCNTQFKLQELIELKHFTSLSKSTSYVIKGQQRLQNRQVLKKMRQKEKDRSLRQE
jgi:hypothetical protein